MGLAVGGLKKRRSGLGFWGSGGVEVEIPLGDEWGWGGVGG